VVGPQNGVGQALLDMYRQYGYRLAELDPLRIAPTATSTEIDGARSAVGSAPIQMRIGGQDMSSSFAEADALLRSIYSGHAAIEAQHLLDRDQRDWLYETYERQILMDASEDSLAKTLEAVMLCDVFESFIKKKWPAKKRFGSEGSETSAVILHEIFRTAALNGVQEVVIGGMHRGRLAMLATVLGKSLETLIAEIKGIDATAGDTFFTGDVPYHNGLASSVDTGCGIMNVRLLPHPSHLTVVAAVALGAARARQEVHASQNRPVGVLSLQMHTDAAFSGQGLVSELLQIGGLDGYSVGGTIHLIVNNQIGFTTLPTEGRSTPSPTDIGKAYGIPIFHVNGDDPIAAAAVARTAFEWRKHTGRDALIDLICYRRNGHNELDEPRFTQPKMWSAIDNHPALKDLYADRVKHLSARAWRIAEERCEKFSEALVTAFKSYDTRHSNSGTQETIVFAEQRSKGTSELNPVTGLPIEMLVELGSKITAIPDHYNPDPKVKAFAQKRFDAIANDGPINLATAEALAFASLLAEGISVRLSGQDCVRGTFTQRHLAVHDRNTGESFMPLAQISAGAARFDAVNSPLIEYGVLCFEYGMSLADPDRLIMWEAQFGDFLNGAQIAVDQYIVTTEAKWQMKSSLVVALPHGLEGQGPDHSSARIERILQSCAGGNIIVVNPSTPANLFHLLRRQQKGGLRKPLFYIAPKSLLRDSRCISHLTDFGPGTGFKPVLANDTGEAYRQIIFCSGKIYYPLEDERTRRDAGDVLIIRLEQLYPFPLDDIRSMIDRNAAAELVWCQEEPRNQGAYSYVRELLSEAGISRALRYIGRPAMAAAAGGSIERHEDEQASLISAAFEAPHDNARNAAQ